MVIDAAYYIYKTTCLVNGKIYIGKHKIDLTRRDKYLGSGVALKEAILKYGEDNFSKEIIDFAKTREEANEKEKYWIAYLKPFRSNGYNISLGGDGGCTHETGLKIAALRKMHGTFCMKEETKKKISESNKGKPKSEAHKFQLSLHHRTRTLHTVVFEDGREPLKTYDSVEKIAKKFNVKYKALRLYSASGIFLNGIRLEDYFGRKYKNERKLTEEEKQKRQNSKYLDPIKKDIVSFYVLRKRKSMNKDLYLNVEINDCILE